MATQSTMANAGRAYVVTTNDHGQILNLGNVSDGRTGTFSVVFAPNPLFVGQFGVVGRPFGKPANDDGLPFQQIPYRRVTLGGTPSDRTIVSDPLTGAFIIEVPATGLVIGLLVACTQGGGTLYNWPCTGSPT